MKTAYIANDGTEFSSPELCLAYERLVEAGIKSKFHTTAQSLFNDCGSWSTGPYPDDPNEHVFRFTDSRDFAKFKTALFKALPALNDELEALLPANRSEPPYP